MRYRPGDLAVVINAVNKQNIGKIVRVLRPYDGTGGLVMDPAGGPQWLIRCAVPIVWGWPGKKPTYRRKQGPAYDAHLQPIRGADVGGSGSTATERTAPAELEGRT